MPVARLIAPSRCNGWLSRPRSAPVAALLVLVLAPWATAEAQPRAASEKKAESATIEPYTGPPIYLPEVEPPPPPTVVERRTETINFPDSENLRFERGIARLSDNTAVSDGAHKEYFSNGQLFVSGEYAMGKAVGTWTYHHENGQVAKTVTYVDGNPDGEVTLYNDEGKVVAKRSYKEGVRHGDWEAYSPDGSQKLREESYIDGKADGAARVWFPNGQLRQEVNFRNGQREGVAKEWDRLGKLRAEANYKDNQKDGVSTLYRADGVVVRQQFEEGRMVRVERSDDD